MPLQQRVIEPVNVGRSTLPLPPGDIKPLIKTIAAATGQGLAASAAAAANVNIVNELECVTNGTLANLIRQLSSLSRQAEELLTGVFDDASKLLTRTVGLQQRMDALAVKVEVLDQPNDASITLRDPTNQRETFSSDMSCDQQVLSKQKMPSSIAELYQTCDKPPPLNKLDPYRDDGKDGLKFYTDPTYFFELWKKDMMKETIKAQQQSQQLQPQHQQQRQRQHHHQQQQQQLLHQQPQVIPSQQQGLLNQVQRNQQDFYGQLPQQPVQQMNMISNHANDLQGRQAMNQPIANPATQFKQPPQNVYQPQQTPVGNSSVQANNNMNLQQTNHYSLNQQPILNNRINQGIPASEEQQLVYQMNSQFNLNQKPEQPPAQRPQNVNTQQFAPQQPLNDQNQLINNQQMTQLASVPNPDPAFNRNQAHLPVTSNPDPVYSKNQFPLPPPTSPPPPPPPPAPPAPATTIAQPPPVLQPPTAAQLQQKQQQLRKTVPVQRDPRSDLLAAIKQGITLRRVEDSKRRVEAEKQQSMGNDVASILARRVAMQVSDSDDNGDDDDEDNDWDDSNNH